MHVVEIKEIFESINSIMGKERNTPRVIHIPSYFDQPLELIEKVEILLR